LSKGWYGMVPGVRNENVDGLEMYLMYGAGMWLVWKGSQSMDWVCGQLLLLSTKDRL
jgi:hypothetical protein